LLASPSNGLTHIGQSTHVVCLDGVRVLTDPWFCDPAYGSLTHEVAAPLSELGPLDAIVITHDHPDHADPVALDRYDDKSRPVIVGVKTLQDKLLALGYRDVRRLSLWETTTVKDLRISAVPALHDVPEVGFVLRSSNHRVYFAGDTAFDARQLAEIRDRHRPSVAILPVDGTAFRFREASSMTPEDAANAALLLGCSVAIASHADARFDDFVAEHVLTRHVPHAARRFCSLLTGEGIAALAPTAGQTLTWSTDPHPSSPPPKEAAL
jgi:L-ascorbate metabolism protein UlaG (beta-lactamase superfamily)